MKHQFLIIAMISILALVGCASQPTQSAPVNEKTTVAATFFPLYELTKMVAGSTADVFSIVPAHSEPHSFVATPQDIVKLNKANIFVTLGVEFEQFEEELAESAQDHVSIVKAAKNIQVIDIDADEKEHEKHNEKEEHHDEHGHEEKHGDEHSEEKHDDHSEESHAEHEGHEEEHSEHDEHAEDAHDHHHHGVDPHVWLSPKNAIVMVQNIEQGLSKADPTNAQSYKANAQSASSQLATLHSEFESGLQNCAKDTILVAHNAYSYLGQDYGFTTIEIAGLSPESEPTPKQIAQLIDEAQKHDLKYIFYEELVDPRVSNTIAQQVGADTLALNPVAGTKDGSATYMSIMRENLANLQIALECN